MKKAKLTVYYGPMFSGKSAHLIKDILSNIDTPKLVFKPTTDVRSKNIYTREGIELKAIPITYSKEILDNLKDWVDVIYIDESHFYDEEFTNVIKKVLDKGIDVVLAGLDTDFRTSLFKQLKELIDMADKAIKLQARCHLCGKRSTWTARFIDGKPAPKNSPTILSDKAKKTVEYKTLCTKCHPFLGG